MAIREIVVSKEQQERRLSRLRIAVVAALVACLGIAVLVALHFRAHLLWRYQSNRLGLDNVRAVPNQSMPDSPTPKQWLRYRTGCIEFALPPDLARNVILREDGASLLTFEDHSRTVLVAPPTDGNELSDLLNTASALCPQSQPFTMPMLRRACYQASSDDFRWSMTRNEVRWHAFCITAGKAIRTIPDGHTESILRKDWDGIIHFGEKRAVFEWHCNSPKCGGYMHFIERGESRDPAWIRTVVQSLKILENPM